MDLLRGSELHTYRPYKGEVPYFSIPVGGDKSVDAAWSYEEPYASVFEIQGHILSQLG